MLVGLLRQIMGHACIDAPCHTVLSDQSSNRQGMRTSFFRGFPKKITAHFATINRLVSIHSFRKYVRMYDDNLRGVEFPRILC